MDHSRAPVLEALQEFRERGYVRFNAPGHRQGRGVDQRVLDVVGEAVFASDVISLNGLDDRLMTGGVIKKAQELMADAVDAEHAFPACPGRGADGMPTPKPVYLPTPDELQLETAMLPRDAFFAEVDQVGPEEAVGRIAAEMITPYPPGAPAILPGEVINEEVVEYVRSGLAAGMVLPDPTDSELKSFRVVAKKR